MSHNPHHSQLYGYQRQLEADNWKQSPGYYVNGEYIQQERDQRNYHARQPYSYPHQSHQPVLHNYHHVHQRNQDPSVSFPVSINSKFNFHPFLLGMSDVNT